MRAVIYTRYSTDRQSESSIEDQVRVCRDRAEREGLQLVGVHSDGAVSGTVPVGARVGGNALLCDAMADRFDVLVLEGLDRLSRDQVEQERIVRRLEHRGMRIIGVADGYDSRHGARKIMRGVRGLINELYIDDLRHKTQRGMHGQVDRGFIASGKCYGYDIERTDAGSRYVINTEQARWVLWIFEQMAAGRSIRSVVYELNACEVPSPRGKSWAVSAIYGSPIKGSGLVNNVLYRGVYIWNRSQWVKDPDTGKRQRIERPRSEWRIGDMPALRIVPEELWLKVRARIDAGRGPDGRKAMKRPMATLLGGLMHCPHCGGPMTAVNSISYGCNRRHDSGETVCAGFFIKRDVAEKRLISVVRNGMLSPKAAMVFEQEMLSQISASIEQRQSSITAARRRLAQLDDEIQRLVDALASAGGSAALLARLQASERERDQLAYDVSQMPEARDELPNVRHIYRTRLAALNEAMKSDTLQAREALRDVLGRVDIELRRDAQEVWAKIETAPALLMALGAVSNGGSGGLLPPLQTEIRLI